MVRDHLDAIPFEHGDVHELAAVAAVVLDDQQPRRRHLQHDAGRGNHARRAPHAQRAVVAPDAQVNAGPLDGRRHPHERHGASGSGGRT